jgi:hypothetical protein
MKAIATLSLILLCAVAVSVLLGSACLSGELCRAEESETGDEDEAEGDVVAPSPRIRADAVLVQVDRGAIEQIERAAGIKLSAEADQVVLKPEQMDKLLGAVRENAGARVVASSSALTGNGKKGLIQLQGELIHPIKPDKGEGGSADLAKGEGPSASPASPSRKTVIGAIKLTPTVMKGGRIALVATLEISVPTSRIDVDAAEFSGPLFRSWTKTTSLIIPDGSSFALKQAAIIPFSPAGTREKASAQKRDILRKLDTVIPQVHFEDAGLMEVIHYLSRQCELNIVIDPSVLAAREGGGTSTPLAETPGAATPSEKPRPDISINIQLENVPLKELLKYILRYKKLKYVVEDVAVVVVPEDWTAPKTLETEIYHFGQGGIDMERIGGPAVEALRAGASGARGKPQSAEGQAIQDFLCDSGITWPEGSSLNYNADTAMFVVTNTTENMALIRESLPLWADPESRGVLLTIISAKIVEPK